MAHCAMVEAPPPQRFPHCRCSLLLLPPPAARPPLPPPCRAGAYSCLTCRFFDDDLAKQPYHCDQCGICRCVRGCVYECGVWLVVRGGCGGIVCASVRVLEGHRVLMPLCSA